MHGFPRATWQRRKHSQIGHMLPRLVSRSSHSVLLHLLLFLPFILSILGFFIKILLSVGVSDPNCQDGLVKQVQSNSIFLYSIAFYNFSTYCQASSDF